MSNQLFGFFVFAFLGVGMEIIFTSGKRLVHNVLFDKKIDWALLGYSPVWMVPIYGSSIFVFPLAYGQVGEYSLFLRALVYGIVILIIEFASGYIIKLLTGKIPWHYRSRWTLGGFVRLYYLPFWMVAGLVIEFVYKNVILR
jgi:hypothetical protein